jgi:hypothetical protein
LSNSINPHDSYYPNDQEELAGAEHQDQILQPGENWPSPYNDPGAPPHTGISTPSSEGQPYNDPGAPPPTGVSTPSSHHSQASGTGAPLTTGISPQSPSLSRSVQSPGGRRFQNPLSPNQSITGQPLSHNVQAQPVASSSRHVAPQQVQTSTSQPTASGSQMPSQSNLPSGTNPERLRRRATVDAPIPYPPPAAVAAGPDPYAAGSRSERIAAARQRRRQLTQQPPPPPLPPGPIAAGRAIMGMTTGQVRQLYTPEVLRLRNEGHNIDEIYRRVNLQRDDIDWILRHNP